MDKVHLSALIGKADQGIKRYVQHQKSVLSATIADSFSFSKLKDWILSVGVKLCKLCVSDTLFAPQIPFWKMYYVLE